MHAATRAMVGNAHHRTHHPVGAGRDPVLEAKTKPNHGNSTDSEGDYMVALGSDDEPEDEEKTTLMLTNREINSLKTLLKSAGHKQPLEITKDDVASVHSGVSDCNGGGSSDIKSVITDIDTGGIDLKTFLKTARHEELPEEFMWARLNEDSASFFISARFKSLPFFTAFFSFSLKCTCFGLILANLIDIRNKSNPFQIPVLVSGEVVVAQFAALFVAVISQDDLLTGFNMLSEGYDSEKIGRAFVGSSRFKWVLSVFSVIAGGALGLFVTFVLIVSSSDVVELLLNFTAVEFVAYIDNVTFLLSAKGFLGVKNKTEAIIIQNTSYMLASPKDQKRAPIREFLTLAGILFMLVGGSIFIFIQQNQGKYVPQTLYVQFDDILRPELGPYSGVYTVRTISGKLGHKRIEYHGEKGSGFAYCLETQTWVFSMDNQNPCGNIIATSSRTKAFDITETGEDVWYASTLDGRLFPMNPFYLDIGCLTDSACGGEGHGKCVNQDCVCNPGYYGRRCDYAEESTCAHIEAPGEEEGEEVLVGDRVYPTKYDILLDSSGVPVAVDGHSVFFSEHGQITDVVVYTGVRWMIVASDDGMVGYNGTTSVDIAKFFQDPHYHPNTHLKNIAFASYPIAFNSPGDGATPASLEWYRTSGDELEDLSLLAEIEAIFICGSCNNETNPCKHEGMCMDEGVCKCKHGTTGALCEEIPTGDALCDTFFNKESFQYDDGDCCQHTCGSEDGSCGIGSVDGVSGGFAIGFPQCLVKKSCEINATSCWIPRAENVQMLSDAEMPELTLSANAHTLVVAEPGLDTVRVFDQIDHQWVQRGNTLEFLSKGEYARVTGFWSPHAPIISRALGLLPAVLAISVDTDVSSSIQVLESVPGDSVAWKVLAELEDICISTRCLSSIDVGKSGPLVTIAFSSSLGVLVFNKGEDDNEFIGIGSVAASVYDLSVDGLSLATLSSDSTTIEIRSTENFFNSTRTIDLGSKLKNVFGISVGGKEMTVLGNDESGVTMALLFQNDILVSEEAMPIANPATAQLSPDGQTVVADAGPDLVVQSELNAITKQWSHTHLTISGGATFSAARRSIVTTEGSEVRTLSTMPRCAEGFVYFRMSLHLDEIPSSISWSLHPKNAQESPLMECSNCYSDDVEYIRVNLIEEGCIPDSMSQCLQFRIESNLVEGSIRHGIRFAAFVDDASFVSYKGDLSQPVVEETGC